MEHFPLKDKLVSDDLEKKYGKISAKVLKHNSKIREAFLVDTRGIARTYALTFLNKKNWTKEIEMIDKEMKSGGSMGMTFRKHGYVVRKNVLDVFILDIPEWLRKSFAIKTKKAKARLSEFYAKKYSRPFIYGAVLEVYSPDFRSAKINPTDRKQVTAATAELEKQGFSKEDIWERIGTNGWNDAALKLRAARKNTRQLISSLKSKTGKVINR